jgi:branched-chain amino acid transport system substrate-binding protein
MMFISRRPFFLVLSLLIVSTLLMVACGAGDVPAEQVEEAAPTEEMGEAAPAEEAEEEAAPTEEVEEEAAPEEEAVTEAECAIEDDDGVITVGAALHLTGWMSAYDGGPRKGALTAVRLLQEAGGVQGCPVEYIELDGQTDLAVLGNISTQLIEQGADFLITPCDFDYGAPAALAAEEAGIVDMATCASSTLYGAQALGPHSFTMSYWTTEMGAAQAEVAWDLGFRTAYLLTDRSGEYSSSLGDYTEATWEHLGGEVLAHDDFQQADPDISAQIQRILALDPQPDVIFIQSYMPGLGAAVRQIRGAGIDAPMVGGDAWDTEEFWGAIGPEMANNMWFVTFSWVHDDTVDPRMGDFITEYTEDWDAPPELAYDVMGYDAVNMVVAAIEEAGTTEGDAVAKALEEITFDGLSGEHTFLPADGNGVASNGHRPLNDVFVITIENGVPHFVKKFRPEYQPDV